MPDDADSAAPRAWSWLTGDPADATARVPAGPAAGDRPAGGALPRPAALIGATAAADGGYEPSRTEPDPWVGAVGGSSGSSEGATEAAAPWPAGVSAPGSADVPSAMDPRRPVPRRRWWRRVWSPAAPGLRWAVRTTLVLLLVGLLWLGDSLGRALTAPGTDPVAARIAEWARFHGLGSLVTGLEKAQYNLHPPRTGGAPRAGIPKAAPPAALAHPSTAGTVPAPAPVTPPVTPVLPGEGAWQTLVSVGSAAAIRVAFVRPDPVHTSYVAGIAYLDPTLVRFTLHPGTEVPGQRAGFGEPATISSAERAGLLATFNSGFVIRDARGGYWQHGTQVGALRTGAAALVFRADGTATVAQWGRDATLGGGVVAVRQNLDLLVDHAALVDGLDQDNTSKWGYTLGNKKFVWRSGVGVTSHGALVYVAGNALSTRTLAQLLLNAGAVRAMELDINPQWTSFMSYTHESDGTLAPTKLTTDEQPNAYRYLQSSSRDFIAVTAR